MFGAIVGAACLIGLIKVIRGRRGWHGGYGHRHGWHHGHRHGCGHGGGCGGGGCGDAYDRGGRGRFGAEDDDGAWGGSSRDGSPFILRSLFERLNTTPGQERVIQEAVNELKQAGRKIHEERRSTVKDVADAIRGDDFSTEAMGNAFARVDGAVETMRTAAFSALAKVHDALDENQRKKLADLLARFGGPSRFADDMFRN
jgi:uncharacterized membrane protein